MHHGAVEDELAAQRQTMVRLPLWRTAKPPAIEFGEKGARCAGGGDGGGK